MPGSHDVIGARYELEEVIADGGMATVWRARDQVLARRVALKLLHQHLAEDEAFLERFRREALAAAGLAHPNIVAIYDTGAEDTTDGPLNYIVMEHCGEGTLATLLRADGPFPTERAVAVGTTICEALGYAHSKGIIHRDVKPANVLIGDNRVLKVGDFGIAKAVDTKTDITTTGKIIGTVAYISPEYAGDQELDARSDLYSLGVVLYELVVGKPPFQESTSVATAMKHLNERPPPLRSRRAGVSRALETVILRALEKDPDDRFASATEMRDALAAVTGAQTSGSDTIVHTPAVAPPAGGEDHTSFRSESRWLIPVIGIIVGALVLAAALSALFGDDPGPGPGSGSDTTTEGTTAIDVDVPADFDPEGDQTEDSSGLPEVIDGNPSTSWSTDIYDDPLHLLKSGVGILFDLGAPTGVAAIELTTPSTDMEMSILAGDTAPTSASDLDEITSLVTSSGRTTIDVGTTARYWVIWITDLPGGGGGSGKIGEVRFLGP